MIELKLDARVKHSLCSIYYYEKIYFLQYNYVHLLSRKKLVTI